MCVYTLIVNWDKYSIPKCYWEIIAIRYDGNPLQKRKEDQSALIMPLKK